MRTRLLLTMIFLGVLLATGTASAETTWQIPLIAGQTTEIGYVEIVQSGTTLTATYTVNVSGWCMSKTHLYVGTTAPEQAAPGQFPYQHTGLGCVTTDTYSVNVEGFTIYVAAHADSHFSSQTVDPLAVPDGLVNFFITNPGAESYFNTTTSGVLSGGFGGWCVDTDHSIVGGATYSADLVSTYEANIPAGLVEFPENWDLVNYILNQDYVGQGYTYSEVQRAIWTFIDDYTSTAGLGTWTQEHVDAILADATANGEGFVPVGGEVMAVILDPVLDYVQITIIPVLVPTVEGENKDDTAWALGSGMIPFGQGWGGYFILNSQPEEDLTVWGPEIEVPIDDQQDEVSEVPAEEETPVDEVVTEETPDEVIVEDTPPVEEPVETPPTEETGETPPAENTGETPPTEDTGETPPAEDTGETPPTENAGRGEPNAPHNGRPDNAPVVREPAPFTSNLPDSSTLLKRCVVTTTSSVSLHELPTVSDEVLALVPAKTRLRAIAQQEGWYNVVYRLGSERIIGWLDNSAGGLILSETCG